MRSAVWRTPPGSFVAARNVAGCLAFTDANANKSTVSFVSGIVVSSDVAWDGTDMLFVLDSRVCNPCWVIASHVSRMFI